MKINLKSNLTCNSYTLSPFSITEDNRKGRERKAASNLGLIIRLVFLGTRNALILRRTNLRTLALISVQPWENPGGGGYSREVWVEVCRRGTQNLRNNNNKQEYPVKTQDLLVKIIPCSAPHTRIGQIRECPLPRGEIQSSLSQATTRRSQESRRSFTREGV